MASDTIFSLETVPGDSPRGVEQPNGDLLLPAAVRAQVEMALLKVEGALPEDCKAELAALEEAAKLLGIEKEEKQPGWLPNLLKVRPI